MCVGIVVVILMAGRFFLVIVTVTGVRPMAMIGLRHFLRVAAVTHKAAMQTKHLRPQHRHKGEQREASVDRGAHGRRIWD